MNNRAVFFSAALAASVTAFAFERFEPKEDPETHSDFKKYDNGKGLCEYDFRFYDGVGSGYTILPEGETGELILNGRTYKLHGGRMDFGGCVPAMARPLYQKPDYPAVIRWERKKKDLAALQGQEIDLLMIGDSITDYWEDPAKGVPVWERLCKYRKCFNLGFGGDGSEHTLWRIDEGELDGYRAKVISILIGSNGGSWTDEYVARGIKAVLDRVREKQPQAKIILNALIPWGEKPASYQRCKNARTNEMIAKFADNKTVFYLEWGGQLLNLKCELTKEMCADFVHPTTKGYEIWYKNLLPMLEMVEGRLPLVMDNRPVSHIHLTRFPDQTVQAAAKELNEFLRQTSSAHVPWLIDDTVGSPRTIGSTKIVIANLADARRIAPKKLLDKLDATENPEAYVYMAGEDPAGKKGVFIVGRTDIATLYGTCAFIEDRLGVRFLHPGPAGTVLPHKVTVSVPDGLFVFREPWASFRRQSTWFGCVKPLDHTKDVEPYQTRRTFMYRAYWSQNSLSGEKLQHIRKGNMQDVAGGEAMLVESVPLVLFESHPEYFPLVDGKRSFEVAGFQERRCLTNPEVKRMVLDYALKQLTHGGGYSLDYRDQSGGWCECERCLEYGKGRDGVYTVPNYALRFEQELQDEILARVPDAALQLLIYRDYRKPVSNDVHFKKQTMAKFCPHQRCYAHPLTAPCNVQYREWYDFWNQRCETFGVFDYYAYSNVPYCPVEYAMAEDFRYYGASNFAGWLEDTSSGCDPWPYPVCNWQMFYVASRMFWDKTIDEKKLLDETYDLYYGSAASVMKRYHARRLELWNACPAHAAMSNFQRYAYCLFEGGTAEELRAFLDEAVKAAKGDKDVLQRIQIDRDCFEKIWVKKSESLRHALKEQKPLDVKRLNGKITIDGELDDEGWKDAFTTDEFRKVIVDYSGKKHDPVPATERTVVRAAYGDDAWYVAFEAFTDSFDTPLKLKTPAGTLDADLWKEDSVEVFLTPPFDGYFHYIINANGALYDSEGQSNPGFTSGTEVKTKILKDRYVVEMRIPVKPMRREKIAAGDSWQLHFFRTDQRVEKSEVNSLDAVWPHVATKFRRVDVK